MKREVIIVDNNSKTNDQQHIALHAYAHAVIDQHGITERGHDEYLAYAARCDSTGDTTVAEKIWSEAAESYLASIPTSPAYKPAKPVTDSQNLEPTDYTDVGQAKLYNAEYGKIARYSEQTQWLVYDGKKWEESNLNASGLAQDLTEKQLVFARKKLKSASDVYAAVAATEDETMIADAAKKLKDAKKFYSFVLTRRNASSIYATLKVAAPSAKIDIKALDANPYLLNTPSGTVDLRTTLMHPHNPSDYITMMTAVDSSDVGTDIWSDFLDRLTCFDKDLQNYLQLIAGMVVVGKVLVENLIIALGEGGNGKSTFFNALGKILGSYTGKMSPDVLIANTHKNKDPEIAELKGKRLVIAAELNEGTKLDTGILKRICSVDSITATKKYKDPFKFSPTHTTILYTNHLPKVGTADKGTWRRLVVVPFNADFDADEEKIFCYEDVLVEKAGGAILKWAIEGARKYIAAAYHIEQPACVKKAIRNYREDDDWFKRFLQECCEIDKCYSVGAQDIYTAYRDFCDANGVCRCNSSTFKAIMTDYDFVWHRTKTGAVYYGLRIAQDRNDLPQVVNSIADDTNCTSDYVITVPDDIDMHNEVVEFLPDDSMCDVSTST